MLVTIYEKKGSLNNSQISYLKKLLILVCFIFSSFSYNR